MTLPKSRLTTLSKSANGHSYIETYLLYLGSLEDSATTDAAIVGRTQDPTQKIIDLQSYVSKQSTK
jgi:hypothetical protein